MAHEVRVLLVACGLALALSSTSAAEVTPVAKVTELLHQLTAQVEADGKKEAAQYDKYACFCKEHVDKTLYAIEKSEKKIEDLQTRIDANNAIVTDLNLDIQQLGQKIGSLADEISNATSTRNTQHSEYMTTIGQVKSAIDALKRAIESLKASKGAMGGKTNLEASAAAALAQVERAVLASGLPGLAGKPLLAFQKLHQPGEAYQFSYHSNEILGVLENLLVQFKQKKMQYDGDEFEANSLYEKTELAMQNQKKFATQEKDEKESVVAYRSEQIAKMSEEMVEEQADLQADKNFLKVLQSECETKASYWDQRSTARAAEITAIAEAIEALETGVASNWGANRQLSGLQKQRSQASSRDMKSPAAASAGHWVYVDAAEKSTQKAVVPSFLQLRGSSARSRNMARSRPKSSSSFRQTSDGRHAGTEEAARKEKLMQLLEAAAGRLGSPALATAALKARVATAEDHFVKVRGIIQDLISRLESEAQSETSAKEFCDTGMAAAVASRDTEKSNMEAAAAEIDGLEASKAKLMEEVAALSEAIAENNKALQEATELRAADKADNEAVIAKALAGKEAVDYALTVLRAYYNQGGGEAAPAADAGRPALLIQREVYVPPNATRDGQTVADLAPEVFGNEEYHGRQEGATGPIGLLEVIAADFERTGTTVTDQEAMSEQDFLDFKAATEQDSAAKQTEVEDKEALITGLKDDIVSATDRKNSAEQAHKYAIQELEKLHTMCVADDSYDSRVASRQKEIEALKEALSMLDDWQR
jgi:hypothetical protein